jgi:hypothetical protein
MDKGPLRIRDLVTSLLLAPQVIAGRGDALPNLSGDRFCSAKRAGLPSGQPRQSPGRPTIDILRLRTQI